MSADKVEGTSEQQEDEDKFRCLKHGNSVYHDVFISYRVNTEKKVADKIALLLDGYTTSGGKRVRTFLDSNCLLDGGNWEQNFLAALHHSKLIVLLISEAGLDLSSASAKGLTKIQNAHREQDNCLLEYEYTIRLNEEKKATVFILTIAQEEDLGGVRCKVKFPTSNEDVAKRLLMYSDTGEHNHRDGTKGPRVQETMQKLLSIIQDERSSAHLDPDDPASRVPDILLKLQEVEEKYSFKQKFNMTMLDLAFLRSKFLGFMTGLVLPFISLLFVLNARAPEFKAFKMGIFMGHSAFLFGLMLLFLVFSYSPLPAACDSEDCFAQISTIPPKWQEMCTYDYTGYCNVGYQVVPSCDYATTNCDCEYCICILFDNDCDSKTINQKAELVLGIIFLALGCGAALKARLLHTNTTKKKVTKRGDPKL